MDWLGLIIQGGGVFALYRIVMELHAGQKTQAQLLEALDKRVARIEDHVIGGK